MIKYEREDKRNDSMEIKYHTMEELLQLFPNNPRILEAVLKTEDHINTEARQGGKIMVSISGGSDSDIMLDMFERLGYNDGLVSYVWYDTGLEYNATKKHLEYLQDKYNITIKRYRPKLTVAQAVKKCGVPFLSKRVAGYMGRLQNHGFNFDSDTIHIEKVRSAQRWWENDWGEKSSFNIATNIGLKEYIMQTPPLQFQINVVTMPKSKRHISQKKKLSQH